MASAPSETPTSSFPVSPLIMILPAGITRALTSPAGVLITTAERFPISARETGTIFLVSSGVSPNKVAIPYGFESCSN